MKKPLKNMLLIMIGIVISLPLFSMTYYTMTKTSTPSFCSSCHEMASAYNAWKTSSHVNNQRGVVANCMDCHLPAPENMMDFFYAKIMHGAKDVFLHFIKGYDSEKAREKVYESIENTQCLKCHGNILYMPYKRGAMLAHRTVLYPRKGYEKKCTDCHRPLVHKERPYYVYLK